MSDLAVEMKNSVKNAFSKQLFITTHSPFFVNALAPDDVWVLQNETDGFSMMKRASDYEMVKEMVNEGVLLGDLWYSNYFGSREKCVERAE